MSEGFFLSKEYLSAEDGEREYCVIMPSEGIGVGDNDDYMRLSGICSHRRGQLMASAPDLLESLDPHLLEEIADYIDIRHNAMATAADLRNLATKQRVAMKKALGEE